MNFEKNFYQPKDADKKETSKYRYIRGVKYEVIGNQKKLAPRAKSPESKDAGLSRRGFLKVLGLGGAALAGTAIFKSFEKTAEFTEKALEQGHIEEKIEPTPEQTEIEKEDFTTTAEILDFDKSAPIEFSLAIVEQIKNGWKKKYRENPKLRDSFIRAYREMGYWRPYLEETFAQQGIPKEYIFLAIPESHWQTQAVSRSGATGPYQFMRATAKLYGLRMEQNFDQRKDPLDSALACAKLLGDLYQRTKDWNLALSGYNGGFLWKYLKETAFKTRSDGKGKKASYSEYLNFVENILNNKKTEIKNLSRLEKVKPGDTLEKIASRCGCSMEELRKNNLGKSGILAAGRTIKTPMPENSKKEIYFKKIRGYSENLNYPAKFFAIKELIDEGFVTEQGDPIEFQEKEFTQSKNRHNFYRVAKGDTLFGIGKRFKTNQEDITTLNPQIRRGLKLGQEIRIPGGRTQYLSLRGIAEQTKRPLERLAFLNPAIKIDAPLPISKLRI